ncbi:MAG: ATP--guanido phosphotransferase [Firmicutes bacterium]|nr:ATP--guanido phosphotransferase [Bacillota bacterium]
MQKKEKEFIVSSRVRLARNAAGLPFPRLLKPEIAHGVTKDVYSALQKKGGFTLYNMARLSALDGQVMKEKHLISQDLLRNKQSGAVIINEAETISVMVNEEDHVRIQCILGGCNFWEAYKIANLIDDDIAKKLRYAYHPQLGYLTACPTNLGTGIRVSAMMFLPGLSINNSLEANMRAISRLNMDIRGVYGEGSESSGYLYQISNERTLGMSEREIINAVEMSIGHIEDAETEARKVLYSSGGALLKDKILRAWGVLTNAYRLESAEFMQLIALVKLGVYYGYIKIKNKERLEKIIVDVCPASLQTLCSQELAPQDRDIVRASYVAKTLKQLAENV